MSQPGPEPIPLSDEEHVEEFHHTRAEYLRGRHSRLWISSGAALAVATLSVAIVVAAAVWVAPAARRAGEARTQAAALAAAQVQSRSNGLRLLHRFDCTYGQAIIQQLRAAESARRVDASIALQQRHSLIASHRFVLADAALRQYDAAIAAAREYRRLRLKLKPLDGGGSCP